MVSNRVCGALCFQDVLLQWLMTDGVLLNQIDAEDPEVSARAPPPHPPTCHHFGLSGETNRKKGWGRVFLKLYPSCNELLFTLQITDYNMLPDTGCLSQQLRVCLQEGDENPRDFTSLFDTSLFNLSTDSLPQVIKSG